ncbi:unnamed protein product [Owenia fusiformis]|uniref:Uncharacterized protein n=1 Tax=Owenia fusiformis TaxID=6347 RepID=A0A8J1XZ54_OWEFU|nr:unnamed protein product [Owenia fusiformis]
MDKKLQNIITRSKYVENGPNSSETLDEQNNGNETTEKRRSRGDFRRRTDSDLHEMYPNQFYALNAATITDVHDIPVNLVANDFGTLANDILQDLKKDSTLHAIAAKTQKHFIGKQEAEIEVVIDMIVAKRGGLDEALLYVVSEMIVQPKVEAFVNVLLHRNANTSATDRNGKTVLHYAAQKKFEGVCQKLLDRNALPHMRDNEGKTPYHIAIENKYDEIGALMLAYMPNNIARDLHTAQGNTPAEFVLANLVDLGMKATVQALLNCLIDRFGPVDRHKIYFKMLDADSQGFPPNHSKFNTRGKSGLHKLAYVGDKDYIYHDAVRLLIRRKWKHFAKFRFTCSAIMFLVSLFILTFAVAVACQAPDPMVYDTPLQIARAVCEVWSVVFVLFHLFLEIRQLVKMRRDYWKDMFNYFDLLSISLLLTVIPLRILDVNEQWYIYSLGYVIWTVRIFKYAAVFRQSGAFAQILWVIITQDIVQFMILFGIILLAFSGSFQLGLRGEGNMTQLNNTISILGTMFMGLRTLVEQQPVTEYTDIEYKWFSIALMVIYLTVCIIILLNLLIARLTDTYQHIQQDCQRGLEINRAWIITRVERNSIFLNFNYRTKYYREVKVVENYKDKLLKWENPPIHTTNRLVTEVRDRVNDIQDFSIRGLNARMERHEEVLSNIQDQLEKILQLQATQASILVSVSSGNHNNKDDDHKDANDRSNVNDDHPNQNEVTDGNYEKHDSPETNKKKNVNTQHDDVFHNSKPSYGFAECSGESLDENRVADPPDEVGEVTRRYNKVARSSSAPAAKKPKVHFNPNRQTVTDQAKSSSGGSADQVMYI